jgi:hypothetical protein
VAALRASAAVALAQLEEAGGGGAADVVAQLRQLDTVKRRMEEACSTLKVGFSLSAGPCLLPPVFMHPKAPATPSPPSNSFARPLTTLPPSLPPLQEAAGLSALFQQVDQHFASGSLPRLADALAGMRRGLAVVGDSVAEFRGG